MIYQYQTQGTCSKLIVLDVEDGILNNVQFIGGCNGNLQGISKLVAGMKVDDIIAKIEHISCNGRPTSCPDQLAQALKSIKNEGV
ncbi:MAG: TIGR03905 family TSCPD domain-containing protein [Bacteroidaceae bacterium]|nr:TIGR03905 family TSCPD domain-containing protein [Bacteroidaceae bacterium]